MHALLIAATLIATDPRTALVGTWDGESLCTPVRPACRDEHAVYHITIPKKAGVVDMLMNKVVDGKEVEMGGTVEYTVNDGATSLTSEYTYNGNHLRWSFTRTGNEMRGTLVNVPDGAIIRNIHVAKK
jgi:hypothetical protein